MVDTTIPGVSAEIVQTPIARPLGTAGRIAIVGKFEKADANTAYFFDNPRSAGNALGTNINYSGSNVIKYAFQQDTESNNYGATSIICVKAGASVAATKTLVDGSSAVVHTYTARGAGVWANGASGGLKYTIAAGTLGITGTWKFTLKLNDVVVETYDNVTTTQLKNSLNAYSQYITCTASATELARTPVAVTDQAFAGGTETASPSTSDLNNALAVLLSESFDILIFTDTPDTTYLPSVKTWLDSKLALDKPSMAFIPLDPTASATDTVAEAIAVAGTTNTGAIKYINQTYTMGDDILTAAESCARRAAFSAGLSVQTSATNKIINDITAVNPIFNSANTYNLTNAGIEVMGLKNREQNKYGVVSAVTASVAVDDMGKKTGWSEEHAVRTLYYVLNYLNLESWLGATGDATLNTIEGELDNRISTIADSEVVDGTDDIVVSLSADPNEIENAINDLFVRAKGILKHIHTRASLGLGGV